MLRQLSDYVFGEAQLEVLPVGANGMLARDAMQVVCDALERSIQLHEASVAEGKENPPPTLSKLDPCRECRISRPAFDAILAFEAANAGHYETAVPVLRKVPAEALAAGVPADPIKGDDGKLYEPAGVYIELVVGQLFARWYCSQLGYNGIPSFSLGGARGIPWPPKEVRFGKGDRVGCQVAPGQVAAGKVVQAGRCGYLEYGFSQPSPYQVKLDSSEVGRLAQCGVLPATHDGYIHAPMDIDDCIRAEATG